MKIYTILIVVINLLALCGIAQACEVPDPEVMVLIPGGEFEMGDHSGDGNPAELPVHKVFVDSFYMRKYETTNRQYCDFLNAAMQAGDIKVYYGVVHAAYDASNRYPYCDTSTSNPSSQIDYVGGIFSVRTKGGRDMSHDPMVTITWYGSVAYCNWLSQQEGYESCYAIGDPKWPCDFMKTGYRLPTEAEFEYAARGHAYTPYTRFPWGDTISHSQANYWSDATIAYDVSPTREYHPTYNDGIWPYTAPVGSFAPNGYGLYDMAGNAFEWVNDWYGADYFSVSPYLNPRGPAAGIGRILLGGGWGYEATYCRNSTRLEYEPDSRCHYRSFRMVLDLEHNNCYTGPDQREWISVGRPQSWCAPRQCHGDASNSAEIIGKCGPVWVGYKDIEILVAGFHRPYYGDPAAQPWIAADFNHRTEKIGKGTFRVGYNDINVLLAWFKKSLVPTDCQTANPVRP
jgi:sulfatase modifying factor 1